MAQSKLYLIETKMEPADPDAPGRKRLVEAVSDKGALAHVTRTLFDVRRIGRAVEVGELVRSGIEIEKAGEPQATRVNAASGYREVRFATFLPYEQDRPATLAELTEEQAGSWRVNAETGLVQFLPTGADAEDATAWHDIREATPAELAEAKGEPAPEPPAKRGRRAATK